MPKETVCPRCKDTRYISVKEGHFYKSIKCPDCNKEKETKPKRPRGRPRGPTREPTKRPRGRPRGSKNIKAIPRAMEICPVCKGTKRIKSKKWGTDEKCTACKGRGKIPFEDRRGTQPKFI